MSYLITGATGFVGGRLVDRLLATGARVRVLVRRPVPALEARGVTMVLGDVREPETLAPALVGAACVIHLAAKLGDWGPERDFVATNLTGTTNLLTAARATGVARFVYVSSFVVYGEALLDGAPCDEDRPIGDSLVSAYGRSKRDAERACEAAATATFRPTIIRPGNIYGPGAALWVDEVIASLRKSAGPLIDGGERLAVLSHVDNVVDALILAATTDAAAGRTYNVNDGSDLTWGQYMRDLAAWAGLPRPKGNLPGALAHGIGAVLEAGARAIGRKKRPLLTREAVRILRCRAPIPIARAQRELGFTPALSYQAAQPALRAYIEGRTAGERA